MYKRKKYGFGTSSVEVENKEVAETPMGGLMQFFGNTHEQGGIDANLPQGTKVFSDRLSVDGKTMQERKLARERRTSKLDKYLSSNPTDKIRKDTLGRISNQNEVEEKQDLSIQTMANMFMNSSKKNKLAFGTSLDFKDILGSLLGSGIDMQGQVQSDYINDTQGIDISNTPSQMNNMNQLPASSDLPPGQTNPIDITGIPSSVSEPAGFADIQARNSPSTTNPNTGNFTTGDVLGMVGNGIGSLSPLLTTLANRRTDTPNRNAYSMYGRKGLSTLNNSYDKADQVKNNQMSDLTIRGNAAKNSIRNNSRSINTQRAFETVLDANNNQAASKIQDSYLSQIMSLNNTKSQMQNQQDQVVMGGNQQKDLADRQDKDNFYTNLGSNLGTLGKGIQTQGKAMNANQYQNNLLSMLNQMYQYGMIEQDVNGNIKIVNKK